MKNTAPEGKSTRKYKKLDQEDQGRPKSPPGYYVETMLKT